MIGKVLLRWLISLFIIMAIVITILLTPLGLRLSLHIVDALLPGKITYQQVSGIITGPIAFKNFKYTEGKTALSIKKLTLSWQPFQLLNRKIVVSHFLADTVHLTIGPIKPKPKKATKAAPQSTKKPFLLDITNAHITQLSIGTKPNKYPVFIPHTSLNARVIPDHIVIKAHAKMLKPFPLTTHFNVSGNQNRYTLYARAMSPKFSWHLYGQGNTRGIFLNLQEGKTLGGKLSFHANIHWAPQLQWDVNLNGTRLNFKTLHHDWPRPLNIQLNTQGSIKNNTPTFSLKTRITAPGTHIDLAATQNTQLNAKWNVAIAQLSHLYQPFRGSLHSKGEWAPEAKIPVIKGELQANNLSILKYKGHTIHGKWMLYPKQNITSRFDISGTDVSDSTHQLKRFQLQGWGTQQSHQLKGSIHTNQNQFAFQIMGGLFKKIWKGQLQKLLITSKHYHNWQLTKPTHISLSKERVSADDLCLHSTSTTGKLCLQGSWDAKKAWQFHANGQHFHTGLLTSVFLPKLTLDTSSTLRAIIRGQGEKFQEAHANIQFNKGSIRYQLNGNYIATPLQQGHITLQFTQHTANASARFTLSKKNWLDFSASLPDFSSKKFKRSQRVNGTIKANFSDLSLFQKTLKAIAKPRGRLSANLSISGALSAPDVQGRVQLHDGSVFIPNLGITLNHLDANISSFSRNKMHFNINARTNNQPIRIKGNATMTAKGLHAETRIDGNNLLIMNTPEYVIYATPQLNVIIDGHNIDLTGRLDIPKATIKPRELTNVASLPSDQIVYTAGEPETTQTVWSTSTHLQVSLGKDVVVNTAGFNANVSGQATIIGKPKTTALAEGRINIINGVYSAYGKTLTISPGSYIQFINSPIDNPNFNIRATKLIQVTQGITGQQQLGLNDIIVGVEIRGSFRHMKISFFSVPSNLSQADILSYLVLGYSSTNTTGSNLGLLLQAANTLGGKGAGVGGAVSEIKQGLGLTELGIESQSVIDALGTPIEQQTSFVIGKRLTKNIYIRYSLGLGRGPFAPVNVFQLRYTINPHWTLQTDSSTLGNGGDILYTIEMD